MTRDEAVQKIKKCLALAASDNPGEREAALRQAHKLMELHALDLGDVHAAEAHAARVSAKCVTVPDWLTRLANACARAFGVRSVTWRAGRGSSLLSDFDFVGCGAGAELAAYAFEVLRRQLERERRRHVGGLSARCKPATKRRRGDEFAHGFVDGVERVVRAFAGCSPAQAGAIDAFIRRYYPGLYKQEIGGGKGGARDANSRTAGRQAGSQAQLHRAVDGADASPRRLGGAG